MLGVLTRKARQLLEDPVLRQWLCARMLGRTSGESAFTPYLPPYLTQADLRLPSETPTVLFRECSRQVPQTDSLTLRLPGSTPITLQPGEEDAFVRQNFADCETLLSVHRFAWLPQTNDVSPAWVCALWKAWRQAYATPDRSWAWHPYTAAERVINVLTWARMHGLPGPAEETAAFLAAHAPVIAEQLEYFGEHYTSNHLANNGRGLYVLGTALGLPAAIELGLKILRQEARRIFLPSGVLREGSSHYHLLLTRSYISAWLAALSSGREEAMELKTIAEHCIGILAHLDMPGGFPLIGDVSPDCSPDHLYCLLPSGNVATGWSGTLPVAEQEYLTALIGRAERADDTLLLKDGWLTKAFGAWHGLWHCPPQGWSHMPGHGHQDAGSFELHWNSERVIVDPGRGAYGETGDAKLYRSSQVHSLLSVDRYDPYPTNRPYYSYQFRQAVSGPAPALRPDHDRVVLRHHGYARLHGVGAAERSWRFQGDQVDILDTIEGRGRHLISRRLVTPLTVEVDGYHATMSSGTSTFKICSDAPLSARPVTLWHAYGEGRAGTIIEAEERLTLPCHCRMSITRI